jgi:hypothetical protein
MTWILVGIIVFLLTCLRHGVGRILPELIAGRVAELLIADRARREAEAQATYDACVERSLNPKAKVH